MASNESPLNNNAVEVLSDTEEMEDSEAEDEGGETYSEEIYFRPIAQNRVRRIEDTEENPNDRDTFVAVQSDSSEDDENMDAHIRNNERLPVRRIEDIEDNSNDEEIIQPIESDSSTDDLNMDTSSVVGERPPPRYRRIHLDENSLSLFSLSEEEESPPVHPRTSSLIAIFDHLINSDTFQVRSNDENSSRNPRENEDSDVEFVEVFENRNNALVPVPVPEFVDVFENGNNVPVPELIEVFENENNVSVPVPVSFAPPSAPSTSKENEPSTSSSVQNDECEESAETCPICFDIWSNVGTHRIVSLKCGHLFGKSCIERWLQKPGGSKCPQCNAKAVKKDIRIIYAKSVKVEDTSEKERLMQEIDRLKRENAKHEREKVQQKMKITQDFQYITELQKQLKMLQESTAQSSQSSSGNEQGFGKGFKLGLYQTIDLSCKNGSCRVMAFNKWMNMIVISVPSHVEMFPGFGMKKISTIDFKTENFYHLHSKQIRDFAFNPIKEDLLLSVGFDKVAKVTNVSSNSTAVSYATDAMLWCCCWSRDNTSDFFVGTALGSIYHFDTVADTEKPVKTYHVKGTGPVVSLNYVTSNPNSSFLHRGLLVTRLDSISFEEFVDGGDKCVSHDLCIDGTFTHAAYDPDSMHLLLTCRANGRNLHVRHKLFALKSSFGNPECRPIVVAREIHSFQGSTTMKVIERACLTTCNNGQTLLALFNEESTNSVKVCDVRTTIPIQTVKPGVNIIDILPIKGSDGDFIAMLAEKCIKIYKWIPQL